MIKATTEKSSLFIPIKEENAIDCKHFYRKISEVHLPSWHRDHDLKVLVQKGIQLFGTIFK